MSAGMRMLLVIGSIATGGVIFGLFLLYIIVAITLQPISNFFLLLEPTGRRALTRKERGWAIFTGVVIAGLLGLCMATRLYPLVIAMAVYLALFALGVYLPQFIDWWRARREERLLASKSVS